MTEIAQGYATTYGTPVEAIFGPSTALMERLANGEVGDLLASADMAAPGALTQSAKAGPTVQFASNHLCAILRPGISATPASLLDTLLKPSVRIATSTPHNDPVGDYAWAVFARANAVKPGSQATLEIKAIKIGNVLGSLAVPAGVANAIVWLFAEQRADIFLSYCTGAAAVAKEMPGISVVQLPSELAVDAHYGLTVLHGPREKEAAQLALYILSAAGQKILAHYGFDTQSR